MITSRLSRAQHATRSLAFRSHLGRRRWSSASSPRNHDPLRVLFCGADEFSIYSLRALRGLQQSDANEIDSIEVVCRPDKRVGRGLKTFQEVPIKHIAQDLGMRLHQIDSFREWSLPAHINLVVAVSFGLLVPARILQAAKYGGLNVHPSLLPELRGAAPIQHTLLQRKTHTGVTVQTMHPTKFDHGVVLAQTPPPGLEIPNGCTPAELVGLLGPLGAEMLCTTLQDGLFVSPVQRVESSLLPGQTSHAPKITPQDRRIDWDTWSADDIIVRDRVMGRLWDTTTYQRCIHGDASSVSAKRTTFQGPWQKRLQSVATSAEMEKAGQPILRTASERDRRVEFLTMDGYIISPTTATIEGERKNQGLITLQSSLQSQSRLLG